MGAGTTYYVTISEMRERQVRVTAVNAEEAREIAAKENAPCLVVDCEHWTAVEEDS